MSLNTRDIAITFEVSENSFGLGLDLRPSAIARGKIFCKIVSCLCRVLSGSAPTDDEIEVVASAIRKNRLAWLNLSRNKITRITKPLCELSDLKWLNLAGMQ
jgi:Leucine-rich repeat (LRR) protein